MPLLVPTPTRRFTYLAWRDSKTWYPVHLADNWRKILTTAIGRSPPSGFFSAISFAPKKYGRSSEGTFPSRITFTKFVKCLRKFSPVCPFDLAVKFIKTWGEMPSNPALEPLGKGMRALFDKNSKNERQLISVGSGTEQVSRCRWFNSRAAYLSTVKSAILSCRRLVSFWFRPKNYHRPK